MKGSVRFQFVILLKTIKQRLTSNSIRDVTLHRNMAAFNSLPFVDTELIEFLASLADVGSNWRSFKEVIIFLNYAWALTSLNAIIPINVIFNLIIMVLRLESSAMRSLLATALEIIPSENFIKCFNSLGEESSEKACSFFGLVRLLNRTSCLIHWVTD